MKKTILTIVIIVTLVIIVLFLLFKGCEDGSDKCINSEYFICENSKWVNQGEVQGLCGVQEEPSKEIYYRFYNNSCSVVSIYQYEKTSNDYSTLEECQENIQEPPEENCLSDTQNSNPVGIIGDLRIDYQRFSSGILVVRLTKDRSTTWAGVYDCETNGKSNADKILGTGWISQEDYPKAVKILEENPSCDCFT